MACHKSSLNHQHHHRRNHSGELDVFEAARYFSGFNDVVSISGCDGEGPNPNTYSAKPVKVERQQSSRGGRKSLDAPTMRAYILSNGADRKHMDKEKKQRQPSSPGGKIASFLSSLFNQSSSSSSGSTKKKKKSTATRSLKEEDEISPGGWRRRRRSSISHFRTSSAVADSKSFLSSNKDTISLSSEINHGLRSRSPPPYMITTSRKDLRSLSDHRQAAISVTVGGTGFGWSAEKRKANSTRKEVRSPSNIGRDGDGGGNESDSSSDLFELPVYETTRIESIRAGTISTSSPFMEGHL